jgi:hypothetical protein
MRVALGELRFISSASAVLWVRRRHTIILL